ncbi:AAA domain protein [Lyngbya aestuarii BL J]|uniref:AAA domain protein n=1 Tax=Lyngbya aestuarii BL J TaxID=1348334 RepID=U7QH04_9CYAN|nr:phosphotransacetylase family protein [Lyngbya aestuarii]ERT06355.1 AAA domain protein [Lyngbya aestuarii BL J]
MAKPAKYLLIGSTQPFSGKSAIALGLAPRLRSHNIQVAYGKPLGTEIGNAAEPFDADVQFIATTLGLSADQIGSPVVMLTDNAIHSRLQGEDTTNFCQALASSVQRLKGDLILLEGPGTLQQGSLFDLSLSQIAHELDASVMLVERLESSAAIDGFLVAKAQLGDRLMGILVNDLPAERQEIMTNFIQPFLEREGIPLLGVLPRNALLRSVTVEDLVKQLQAQVLCGGDHLNMMVESLSVGAMNVSAAMKYFDRTRNMAVVTGGDRTDIQLAALEKSTHCLILTGQITPDPMVLTRAEDLEVPVLCVDLDTLTTVETIDRAFGQVRVHEPSKVECITQLMAEHFDFDSLMKHLGLEAPVPSNL